MNLNLNRSTVIRLLVVALCLGVSLAYPSPEGVGSALIVATAVINKDNYKSWTLTALDADVALALAHGFKGIPPGASQLTDVAPDFAIIQPLVSYASSALPTWGIVATSTLLNIAKTNATASGGATPGTTVIAKVYAWRPNSSAM